MSQNGFSEDQIRRMLETGIDRATIEELNLSSEMCEKAFAAIIAVAKELPESARLEIKGQRDDLPTIRVNTVHLSEEEMRKTSTALRKWAENHDYYDIVEQRGHFAMLRGAEA